MGQSPRGWVAGGDGSGLRASLSLTVELASDFGGFVDGGLADLDEQISRNLKMGASSWGLQSLMRKITRPGLSQSQKREAEVVM